MNNKNLIRSLNYETWDQTHNRAAQQIERVVWDKAWLQIQSKISKEIENQICDKLYLQVLTRVYDHVCVSLRAGLKKQ